MSEPRRRGWPARIGIALLNLLAPGLGLLRIGEWRRAATIFGCYTLLFGALITVWSSTENISFYGYAATVTFVVGGALAICVVAICWTLRGGAWLSDHPPSYARWYSIVGAMIGGLIISWSLTGAARGLYRNFYIPTETMEPTLYKNDKLVASMRPSDDLHPGDLLLVKGPSGATYIKRLAALPGDRIALRNGVVSVNGAAAELRFRGSRQVAYPYMEATKAQVYLERLPGEIGSHLIQDLGPSPEDDVAETVVAPAHLYLLGDNRDDSADSRVSRVMGGLEQVPVSDVVGRPLFLYWPANKMGQSLRR